jgi:cytoskeletal protein CcmA (bactofilin family)
VDALLAQARRDVGRMVGYGSERSLQEGCRMAPNGEDDVTVLGRGARLQGDFVISGSIRIDGVFKGKIVAGRDVMLSPGATVEADIEGENVTVGGTLVGKVVARHRAALSSGGRLDGDIRSAALVVGDGAVFNGRSSMDTGGGDRGR